MNAVLVNAGRGTSVVLGLLLATASYGQSPMPVPLPPRPVLVEKPKTELKPGTIHRLEILNGGGITVHYYGGKDLAPTELAALRDLERAENEANYAESMNALRNLYVRDEIQMENRRHTVQMALYGTTTTTTFGSSLGGGLAGPVSMGAYAIPNNYALVQNPFYGSAGLFPGQYAYSPLYPNVYTAGYWGDTGLASSVTRTTGLENGMGDEGVMKSAIAKAMAGGYGSESMATVARSLDAAMMQAADSPRLRAGLGLPDPGKEVPAGFRQANLLLKDGKTEIKGKLVGEDREWYVIRTESDEISVRKDEVMRISRPIQK